MTPKPSPPKTTHLSAPNQLLWAIIGVLLTTGGTFIEAYTTTNAPWTWSEEGVVINSLGVYCQVAAVLLTGCLGGKNAGAIAQIAYICIGLFWVPVFSQGGEISYISEPTFGYILGFVPGVWVCGWLAFRSALSLESLAFSAFCGLIVIHICGVVYLSAMAWVQSLAAHNLSLAAAITAYTFNPFVGQLAIICAVALIAYGIRRVLFY